MELKRWSATNKFSLTLLERLIIDPGVTDVLDLAVLCDEELQRAGLSPIQLKRFAVLQHKINERNPAPLIPHLSKTRDDIRQQLIADSDDTVPSMQNSAGAAYELLVQQGYAPAATIRIGLQFQL